MRWHSDILRRSVALTTIGLLSVSGACDEPHGVPGEYSLIRTAIAPNGARQARLVRQHSRASLTSDGYFVDVVSSPGHTDAVSLSRVRVRTSALYATGADSLSLRWRSDSQLVIACNHCGMAPIDVIETRSRLGSVNVTFVGLGLAVVKAHQ